MHFGCKQHLHRHFKILNVSTSLRLGCDMTSEMNAYLFGCVGLYFLAVYTQTYGSPLIRLLTHVILVRVACGSNIHKAYDT